MNTCTRTDLNLLLTEREGPCVSIYTSTHPGGSMEDPIRWKKQLHEAERQLTDAGMNSRTTSALLAPAFQDLEHADFWKNTRDGMAYYLAPGFSWMTRLPMTFENRVAVGPRFEIRPLLPWILGDGVFYVLALSQNRVRLLRGTAHTMQSMEPTKVPKNKDEALRLHDVDEVLNFHTHPGKAGLSMHAVFHGHGVGIDDHKTDLLLYFQAIERGLEPLLQASQSPLVVATVEYLFPIFRKACKYPHLVEHVIAGNPDHISDQELHDKAWAMVQPLFEERMHRAVNSYRHAVGTGKTTTDIQEVLTAAEGGQLEKLFLVNGRHAWGKVDGSSHRVEIHTSPQSMDDEFGNLAATHMLRRGRTVHLINPTEGWENVVAAGTYFVAQPSH